MCFLLLAVYIDHRHSGSHQSHKPIIPQQVCHLSIRGTFNKGGSIVAFLYNSSVPDLCCWAFLAPEIEVSSALYLPKDPVISFSDFPLYPCLLQAFPSRRNSWMTFHSLAQCLKARIWHPALARQDTRLWRPLHFLSRCHGECLRKMRLQHWTEIRGFYSASCTIIPKLLVNLCIVLCVKEDTPCVNDPDFLVPNTFWNSGFRVRLTGPRRDLIRWIGP